MPEARRPVLPVFVVGMPRSGTTWVAEIMSSPPTAGAISESYMFSANGGLGALFRRVGPERRTRGGPDGLGRLLARPELVAEVREIAERWLARELPPGGRHVVEKSPWHLRDARLIAEVLPAARFVNVVRDGRDVAVSLLAARRTWARTADPRAVRTTGETAKLWAGAIRLGAEAQAQIGERFLELRFEELKSDPEAAIRRLFRFGGLEHDEALVRRVASETAFERRHRGGADRFYRGGRVGDWRTAFSLRDARAFHRAAWRTLLETGYESDARWWLKQPVRRPVRGS